LSFFKTALCSFLKERRKTNKKTQFTIILKNTKTTARSLWFCPNEREDEIQNWHNKKVMYDFKTRLASYHLYFHPCV